MTVPTGRRLAGVGSGGGAVLGEPVSSKMRASSVFIREFHGPSGTVRTPASSLEREKRSAAAPLSGLNFTSEYTGSMGYRMEPIEPLPHICRKG